MKFPIFSVYFDDVVVVVIVVSRSLYVNVCLYHLIMFIVQQQILQHRYPIELVGWYGVAMRCIAFNCTVHNMYSRAWHGMAWHDMMVCAFVRNIQMILHLFSYVAVIASQPASQPRCVCAGNVVHLHFRFCYKSNQKSHTGVWCLIEKSNSSTQHTEK